MIRHAAALIATGTAGFLISGATGACAVVVAWTIVLTARWWLRARKAQTLAVTTEQPPPSVYADIEEVIDRLDDLARERDWDLGKRFEIARMACENRTLTFDQLERRYELGFRSAPDKSRQDDSEQP